MPTAPPSLNTSPPAPGSSAYTPEEIAAIVQKRHDGYAEESMYPQGLRLWIRYAPEHKVADGSVPFRVWITGDEYAGLVETYIGLTPYEMADPDWAESAVRSAYLKILKRSEEQYNRLHAASQAES